MSKSKQEEIIAALWFIAAFTALNGGCEKWVFMTMLVWAGLSMFFAICYALTERKSENKI